MRLGTLSLLGSAIVVASLWLTQGCAAGDPAPAEDTPNLASRRPLPSATTTTEPAPLTDGGPSAPSPEASISADAAISDASVQDAFVPPVDASGVPQAAAGDIVISELLFDPTGAEPDSEWIEIGCRAASARTLRGLTLEDGAGRTHVIASDVIVSPGKFVVLARSRAAVTAQGVAATSTAREPRRARGSSSPTARPVRSRFLSARRPSCAFRTARSPSRARRGPPSRSAPRRCRGSR